MSFRAKICIAKCSEESQKLFFVIQSETALRRSGKQGAAAVSSAAAIESSFKKPIESKLAKPQNRELKFIFDGNCSFNLPLETLIKGDSKIAEISAASILAKVAKDAQMQELSVNFPQYNFAKNKGYLSAEHLCAIEKFGLCEIHRKSYKIRAKA